MIELRHLRYYVAVAEELHFGRAADRLRMAQSPLSHQIRQLERDVGAELINRGHHVVGLTDAGEAFLEAARKILADVDEAVHLARRASRGEVGTLAVGYVSEVTADLLPLTLRTFTEQHRDVELSVREGTTGQLLDGLRDRTIDIAFMRSPRVVEDLDYEQLVEEALTLALPAYADKPWPHPRLTDLAEEHFVLPTYSAAQGLRRDIEIACRNAGFSPKVTRETSPLTAVLLLVAAGVGAALVPTSVTYSYPVPGVNFVRLSEPTPVTAAGMAWRPSNNSAILHGFLEITRDLARTYEGKTDVWPERHILERPRRLPNRPEHGAG